MGKRACFSVVLILLLFLPASAAFAGLAALGFPDTNNEQKTVVPSQRWINPTGEISVYLSAGLERKVAYVLLDGSGQTVAQGVSDGTITPSDQFTVLGQTYYGKILTMPALQSEGDYTLKAQILDGQGNQVALDSYTLTIDRTPPGAGGVWWHSYFYNNFITGNELVSPLYGYNIFVKELSDSIGIDRVQFESFNPDNGSIYYSVPAWYDAAAGNAGIGTGQAYSVAKGVHLPDMDGLLGVRFAIFDKAGNKTVAQATAKYNGTHAPLAELVGVYNPNVTTYLIPGWEEPGWETYTPGMTVHTNPVQLLYRLVRTNWTGENPDYGLSAIGGTFVYSDAQYVYFKFTGPYSSAGFLEPKNDHSFWSPQWTYVQYATYNLTLSPDAPQSPKVISSEWKLSDIGWISGSGVTTGISIILRNQPIVIQQIKLLVEPRNYNQIVKLSSILSGEYTIPAGETEVFIDLNYSTGTGMQTATGTVKVLSEDGALVSSNNYLIVLTDTLSPSITTYTMDTGNKTVTYQVTEPQSEYFAAIGGGYGGRVAGWLLAHNSATGEDVRIDGAAARLTGDNYQVRVSYASLPEGDWQFTLWAQDRYENTTSQSAGQLALDQTPPQIGVFKEAGPLNDHGAVASLGQVRITLTDTVDSEPELTGVRLEGGPPGVAVSLAHHLQDGAYVLEYPVMWPSLGQEYNLAVSARDAAGNAVTRTIPFLYDPALVNVTSTGQETLNLPVLPANVVHSNGANALVSDIITLGGAPIIGSYDLVVMSGAASTPIQVRGTVVPPGEQRSITAYDFAASGSRIDLPLMADGPGRVDLMITSTAPNFPVITAQVNFWRPELQLSADPGWAVQPIISTQRINLLKSAGTPCRLSLSLDEAQTADPVDAPVCLVQWTGLPANYQQTGSYAEGVLPSTGSFTPGYQVSIFNNGQQYQMSAGTGQALERSPITDLAFAAATTPAAPPFYRKVQQVAVNLESSGSFQCTMASTLAEAQEQGARQAVCLTRWTALPEGMQSVAGGANPQASGGIAQAGDQTVAWAVDLYSPYGMVENAAQGSLTVNVENPPLPELAFDTGMYGEQIEGMADTYVTAELQSGQVGAVTFTTKVLNTNVTLELDGIDEGHVSRQYWSARETAFSRTIRTGELNAYEVRPVGMKLYYTDLPEWKVEKAISVMGVPSKRVQAALTAAPQPLDTADLAVKLEVGVYAQNKVTYNAAKDGEWRARIGSFNQDGEFAALTGYQPLVNGVLEAAVPTLPSGNVKLAAEVQAAPPAGAEFYSRSLLSNKIYRTVLKGTAPEGELTRNGKTCTVASGPAPLTAILALKADNNNRLVMGDVAWQLSGDDGATWLDLETRTPYQAVVQVGEGRRLVRVKMKNKLSGAEGYSDQSQEQEGAQFSELIAYQVPKLELTAPRAVIVNSSVTLRSRVTLDGQAVPEGEAVVEWLDGNNQPVSTAANLEITPAETRPLIYRVKARLASAPAEDEQSWVKSSIYLRVVPPMKPFGRVSAPYCFEYNSASPQTYRVQAEARLDPRLDPAAYPVRGEWRFPDRVVEGPTLDYSPTAQDSEKRRVTLEYAAWIDGFKDQTLAVLRRMVTVKTYIWPEFAVKAKASAAAAPSLVTLTAAPADGFAGRLESPVYEWRLPEPATLVRKRENGKIVEVKFPEAGSFEAGVTITDARGSTAEAAAAVALAEPAPFQISFCPSYSNPLSREKLNLTLRTSVKGGHPQDRLTSFEYRVDCPEAQVTEAGGIGVIKGLRQGEHVVHLKATSLHGKVVEEDFPVIVVANQPPSCEVNFWDSGDYRYYQADVRDPDGRVVATRWFRDDVLISSGRTISIKKSDNAGSLRFEAQDDADATCGETLGNPAG